MPNSADIWVLWVIHIVSSFFLLFRLFTKLASLPLRFFGVFIAVSQFVSLLQMFLIGFLPTERDLIGLVFVVWSYATSIFEFLVILELSNASLHNFPAIRRASQRTLMIFWGFIGLVVASWYFYLSAVPAKSSPLLYAAIRYHDATSLGFCIFVLLLLAFIAWMPVPMHRSLLNHAFLLASFFVLMALSRFAAQINSAPTYVNIANYLGLGGTALLFLLWALKLSPVDDFVLNTPKGPLNADEAEEMLARLNVLNETLSRSGPRILR